MSNLGEIILSVKSKAELIKSLGLNGSSKNYKFVNRLIKKHNLNTSHFINASHTKRVPREERNCPVCNSIFIVKPSDKKENSQVTCSKRCANTYFGSARVPVTRYTSICFRYHKKECVVCKENKIVAVHHYDENKANDSPENLIPLCPTHHHYFHSRYKELVKPQIDEYRNNFIKQF